MENTTTVEKPNPKRMRRQSQLIRAELKHAIALFKEAGIEIGGVTVQGDGFTVLAKAAELSSSSAGNELDKWIARHANESEGA